MKVKKFAALFLAVVMAITMLTACGGGGGSTTSGELDLAVVNELLESAGSDVTVKKQSGLTSGVKLAAAKLGKESTFNPSMAFAAMKSYLPSNYKVVNISTVSEATLLSGSFSISGASALGALNTAEKVAAAQVINQREKYGADCDYSASAAKTVNAAGTTVWVIAVLVV